MSIIKWKKNNGMFPTLSSMVDNFFGDDEGLFRNWPNRTDMPAVNVKEKEDAFCLELAIPGMSKDDFNLEIDKGVMTVSSEKKTENEEVEDNYTRKEFSYSSFSRSFWLPENTKEDDISAVYEDGLLSITVPKNEKSLAKEVKKVKIT